MNTDNQNEQQTRMQATEAFPLEDHSLPANEVLMEQQSESTENLEAARLFVP